MFRLKRSISSGLLPLSWLLLCPAVPSPAQTRDAKLDDLAAQLKAKAPGKLRSGHGGSKALACLVMDFQGPDEFETRLDVQLADEFSQALQEKWPEMTVLDRSKFDGDLETMPLGRDAHLQEWAASSTAETAGASVVVIGRVTKQEQKLDLRVSLLNEKHKSLAEASERLELTDARRDLEKLPPRESTTPSPWPETPTAGKNGYGAPKCVTCPHPPFSEDARRARAGGVVILNVLIGEDGNVQDIAVARGLPTV